ncbi:CAAX amino terminal protease family, partial [gut metagenome]
MVQGKIPVGIREIWELLVIGAGSSQIVNILMSVLQIFLKDTSYQESMGRFTDGKSFWFLILTMGIIGPIAEEVVFRWLMYLRLR